MATIADKLTTIAGIKTDIRTAINGKGGSLTSGSPFSAYSAAISSLPSGGGGFPPDWSQIGYTGTPQPVLDAFSYAKTIHDNWNPNVTILREKFIYDKKLVYMPMVETSSAQTTVNMFYGCANLTVVPLLDTSNVTSMGGMFRDCTSLSTVPLFDTSSVREMDDMFTSCSGLTTVPLFDTSSVTGMASMFSACTSLSAVPAFDTSSVTNMRYMFAGCRSLTTVPAFNTSACTNMGTMFYNCSGLTSVPQLDTSNATDMNNMFNGCTSLTTVPAFNTSACTAIYGMFSSCSGLTSIPALNTKEVTNMANMFQYCSSLQKITSLDMDKCTNVSNMFGRNNQSNLRFMLLKGLGTPSGVTSYGDFNRATNWGVDSTDIPDARQSLVDSLLTYSFDRATAGYATCTVKLSSNSYNQLTSQELADIQAKGYNITT